LVREADGGVPDLAQRLNHLFSTVPRPDRQGYWTNEQAAAALAQRGTPMSDGYLSQLRNGKKNNPSARNLSAIAELFGVPMEYFFNAETAAKIDADLRLLTAVRDVGVQGLALRASGLSAESLASLEGIIDQVRKLEHLPEQGGTGEAPDEPPP
jgi:transcriptional regulator with XRE-family HTH domain